MSMKIRLSYLITFLSFLIIVTIYKIPLSTDDYHWTLLLNQEAFSHVFDDYFFRLPVWRIIFRYSFPVLINYPILGKFIMWGAGIIGLYFPLSWFFNKYGLNTVWLPIIAFLTFFAPNQYEVNYFTTIMPYCFGFLFSGLGFYAFRKGHKVIGSFFYLLSILTLESFISLVLLLEFSTIIDTFPSRVSIKKFISSIMPLLIVYFFVRLVLHIINPYSYGIDLSLKFSQIRGLIFQCFFINFYKLNSILSFVQLILYGYLFVGLYKIAAKTSIRIDWIKRILILFVILIMTSSYYYFLEYPANRALSSQISYCWGFYLLVCVYLLSKTEKSLSLKIIMATLLISAQIANQAIIFRTKQYNYHFLKRQVTYVIDKLSKEEKNIFIDLNQLRSGLKRDWIFATTQDAELMFKLYLSPEEFNRINFKY